MRFVQCACSVFALAVHAEVSQAGDVASLLEPICVKHELPAMVGAIVSHDGLRAIGAVGVRRAGGDEGVSVDDAFHIGSCTKAMTATLVAMLVDDGAMDWSTTIGEVFDDVPMREQWKHVTVEQLLHNRGGAPADLSADGLWGRLWAFDGSPREARMALVRGVLAREPSRVGEYVYSNAGFAMAGAMAERAADASWEDLMRRRLFEPLGMTTAGFGAPGSAGAVSQPRGHRASGDVVEPGPGADNPAAIGPAGTVHCSLADWGKFISLHLTRERDHPLLSAESLARLHEPKRGGGEPYAMGWIVTERAWAKGDEGRGVALTHAGSNTMWHAVVWIAPERDCAVLVATNQGGAGAARACDEAAGALVGWHLSSVDARD